MVLFLVIYRLLGTKSPHPGWVRAKTISMQFWHRGPKRDGAFFVPEERAAFTLTSLPVFSVSCGPQHICGYVENSFAVSSALCLSMKLLPRRTASPNADAMKAYSAKLESPVFGRSEDGVFGISVFGVSSGVGSVSPLDTSKVFTTGTVSVSAVKTGFFGMTTMISSSSSSSLCQRSGSGVGSGFSGSGTGVTGISGFSGSGCGSGSGVGCGAGSGVGCGAGSGVGSGVGSGKSHSSKDEWSSFLPESKDD